MKTIKKYNELNIINENIQYKDIKIESFRFNSIKKQVNVTSFDDNGKSFRGFRYYETIESFNLFNKILYFLNKTQLEHILNLWEKTEFENELEDNIEKITSYLNILNLGAFKFITLTHRKYILIRITNK